MSGSTSTRKVCLFMALTIDDAFSDLPSGLRKPLLEEYRAAVTAYREGRWETVGIKAGKLCEVIYTIIRGHVDGKFPPKPSKPKNMLDACNQFQHADVTTFGRPIRIQIPRVLIAVYELRNNRDIGHIGGDVDPNRMDSEFFLRAVKWLLAELIRVFHKADIAEVQDLVEAVSERTIPLVWERKGKIRVLNPDLATKDKVLAILYHSTAEVSEKDLCEWVEYSNPSVFRQKVLKSLHEKKLIEYDKRNKTVMILPPGEKHVEDNVPLSL